MSTVLVSSIILSGVTPAFANTTVLQNEVRAPITTAALEEAMKEAKVKKEEAIALAQKAVNIPEGFKQENISFDSNWMGNTEVWRIEWRKSGDGHHQISVTVDANKAEVIGLDIWSNTREEEATFPPKVDYDEAVTIAKDYIQNLYPNKLKDVKLDELTKERSSKDPYNRMGYHNIQFYQMKNGVPFRNNSIRLTVTGNGDVRNFHFNWFNDVVFEDATNILSNEEAMAIVNNDTTMELRYQFDRYNRRNQDVHLAYVPSQSNYQGYYGHMAGNLDAKTGKWLDHQGKELEAKQQISSDPVSEDTTPLKVRKNELSKEEAYEVVEQLIDLPEDVILENARYHDDYGRHDGTKVWSFDWRKKNQAYPFFMRAEINANTGELIRFNNDRHFHPGDDQEFEVNITKEEAEQKAIEFLKEAASDKTDQLYVTPINDHYYNSDDKPRYYQVYFVRKHEGIPVEGQGVRITISTETGEVTNFSSDWSDLEFPSIDGVISSEKAKEIYLSDMDLNLTYFVPNLYNINKDEKEEAKKAQIIYQPQVMTAHPLFLDALTGEWVNRQTGEVMSKDQEILDIEGHWAKESILTMVDYNLVEAKDGMIYPNKEVTKAEAIKLLMTTLGQNHYYYDQNMDSPFEDVAKDNEYYPYIIRAYQMGLIDKEKKQFNPEQLFEREQLAVLVVKALGYDKLASIEGAFTPEFDDSDSIKAKGHVALIQKLGIMNGADGKFNPEQSLTNAETIVTLLRFLEQKSKLTERRYY